MEPEMSNEAVVLEYSNMVYRLAYAQLHNKSDADDTFQEVFMRYFQKKPVLNSQEHCKAWLIRVTINCAKKYQTSAWNRKTMGLGEELPGADDIQDDSGIADALQQLSARYRTVVHLFYYEDYSIQQISKILHSPQSTVRTQLTRARRQLGELLKGEEL